MNILDQLADHAKGRVAAAKATIPAAATAAVNNHYVSIRKVEPL